jgi:hypothetical protein
MKFSGAELEKRAEGALRSCLSKVPFLKIEDIQSETSGEAVKPDLLIKLSLPEGAQYIVVEVKSSGQPRLAREAVNQLLRYRAEFSGAYGVFMAPYISSKAAEICTKEAIGYADLSGNCRLCFGQVYIDQRGKPNLFAKRRDLRSLYSPKAERVLRVLLNNPRRGWKVADLASEAQVSLGQVSNVKKLLTDREGVIAEASGFVLSEPQELLKEWAENYSFRRNGIQDFYSLKTMAEVEADIAEVCSRKGIIYALTGFSGAARFAPAVRYQRIMAYVEEAGKDLASLLSLKSVTTGANVSLLSPYDAGVMYGTREVAGVKIVSPIQIYLDLSGFRGRGEEAAKVLFEQVIKPKW